MSSVSCEKKNVTLKGTAPSVKKGRQFLRFSILIVKSSSSASGVLLYSSVLKKKAVDLNVVCRGSV